MSSIISNEGLCIISLYLPIIYSRFFSHKLIDTRTALTEQINLRNHVFVAKKNLTSRNMYGDDVLFNTNKLRNSLHRSPQFVAIDKLAENTRAIVEDF